MTNPDLFLIEKLAKDDLWEAEHQLAHLTVALARRLLGCEARIDELEGVVRDLAAQSLSDARRRGAIS